MMMRTCSKPSTSMQSPDRTNSSFHSQSSAWSSSSLSQSVMRLWRPVAQKNLRNQWSKLAFYKPQWFSSSSRGRSHATSLVNTYLSQKYMPSMDLGVLSDMPDIQTKASSKLLRQHELHRSKLLSSYKDLVVVVTHMVNCSRCMRCYVKGSSNSPRVQFSYSSDDNNDVGDGGGISVFALWSISIFEQLAMELVQMFLSELILKRLLVVELLAFSWEAPQVYEFGWSNELYAGEFDHLRICNLYCNVAHGPIPPRLMERKSDMVPSKSNNQPNNEKLLAYLTTWLVELNIDIHRVNEVVAIIEEAMHARLS